MYITLGTQYMFNTPYKPLIFVQEEKHLIIFKLQFLQMHMLVDMAPLMRD